MLCGLKLGRIPSLHTVYTPPYPHTNCVVVSTYLFVVTAVFSNHLIGVAVFLLPSLPPPPPPPPLPLPPPLFLNVSPLLFFHLPLSLYSLLLAFSLTLLFSHLSSTPSANPPPPHLPTPPPSHFNYVSFSSSSSFRHSPPHNLPLSLLSTPLSPFIPPSLLFSVPIATLSFFSSLFPSHYHPLILPSPPPPVVHLVFHYSLSFPNSPLILLNLIKIFSTRLPPCLSLLHFFLFFPRIARYSLHRPVLLRSPGRSLLLCLFHSSSLLSPSSPLTSLSILSFHLFSAHPKISLSPSLNLSFLSQSTPISTNPSACSFPRHAPFSPFSISRTPRAYLSPFPTSLLFSLSLSIYLMLSSYLSSVLISDFPIPLFISHHSESPVSPSLPSQSSDLLSLDYHPYFFLTEANPSSFDLYHL
ncbi:hypothetical protein C7M84_020154 [Penaeus vannamei]|uniref:Uncharacterized protein n=1 Tax=Penaeus vannamei TaxID=6689 RepID=A0A3R7NMH4_PENVA|nr:hypothetical protein C7M84_020154 [Penaeus vannamei]